MTGSSTAVTSRIHGAAAIVTFVKPILASPLATFKPTGGRRDHAELHIDRHDDNSTLTDSRNRREAAGALFGQLFFETLPFGVSGALSVYRRDDVAELYDDGISGLVEATHKCKRHSAMRSCRLLWIHVFAILAPRDGAYAGRDSVSARAGVPPSQALSSA